MTSRSLFLFLLLVAACDDKPKPPPAPPESNANAPAPPASNLASLGLDAGLLGDPVDPPAPAGDLKAELDRFVNVETCVAERAKLDPLVGDALSAIGYETFLRDACRLLEAAKDRKRETCDRIDSSALRSRCQAWVAMIAQTPDACPMQFEALATRGRNASCVAIAAKDPRLCAGEARTIPRTTCDAMIARDPAKCDALLPNHRPICQREVTRWKAVLAAPLEGLTKLPDVKGKLSIHGTSGTNDPPQPEVDVSSDFSHGIVVVTGATGRSRVEIGTVVESEAARMTTAPQKKARTGMAILSEPPGPRDTKRKESTTSLQKFELELPGEAPIVSPPSVCDCRVARYSVGTTRGEPANIVLEGTVNSAGRSYKVTVDVSTFVRDVVPEGVGPRLIPPVHPSLGALKFDAGR